MGGTCVRLFLGAQLGDVGDAGITSPWGSSTPPAPSSSRLPKRTFLILALHLRWCLSNPFLWKSVFQWMMGCFPVCYKSARLTTPNHADKAQRLNSSVTPIVTTSKKFNSLGRWPLYKCSVPTCVSCHSSVPKPLLFRQFLSLVPP